LVFLNELLGFRMLVEAQIFFLAVSVLLVEPADGYSFFVVDMHKLTLIPLLTTVPHPMNTHALLAFRIIDQLLQRSQIGIHIINAHHRLD